MNNNFLKVMLRIVLISLVWCVIGIGANIINDLYVSSEIPVATENNINTSETSAEIEVIEDKQTSTVVEQVVEESIDAPEIQYNSSSSDYNHMYSQLNDYAKIIYDGLENNQDNMKSGTYTVEFGDSFDDLLSQSDGQELLGEYYQSAIEAYTYDHPEVFYLDPTKMYLNIQTTTLGSSTKYDVYLDNGSEQSYLADGFTSKSQIEEYESAIEEIRDQLLSTLSGSTYNKIKQIHDYIVDNTEYDTTISRDNIYNIYGALIEKVCVCEGYAKAFKYLTNAAGINCVIVVGEGTNSSGQQESHAWNYVEVDGTWYAVDCTWDDPIIQGGGTLTDRYKYKYFLKGLNTMSSDHFPDGQFSTNGMIFTYPDISDEDYEL